MSNMAWFRFYSDALSDRKLQRICATTKQPKAVVIGVWTIMLSIANDSPQRGKLLITEGVPITVDEILFESGITDTCIIDAFIDLGMVTVEGDLLSIANWDKRQFTSDSSAERVRRHRAKKAAASSKNSGETGKRYSNVTVTPPDTDTDTDTDTETDNDDDNNARPAKKISKNAALTALITNYEDFISMSMSQYIKDEFLEYSEKVQPLWVANAFKVAEAQNVRKWVYIRAILDRCIESGGWVDRPKGNHNGRKNGTHQNGTSASQQNDAKRKQHAAAVRAAIAKRRQRAAV